MALTIGQLQRWLSGDINREEEQQLLQAAQDDPFLREALNGYTTVPEGQHQQSIDYLRNQVMVHGAAKRRTLWTPRLLRIAAALAILIAAGLSYLVFQRGGTEPELANLNIQESSTDNETVDPVIAFRSEGTTDEVAAEEEEATPMEESRPKTPAGQPQTEQPATTQDIGSRDLASSPAAPLEAQADPTVDSAEGIAQAEASEMQDFPVAARSAPSYNNTLEASPVGGFDAFRAYITRGLQPNRTDRRTSTNSKDEGLRARIAFTLDANGTVKRVDILESTDSTANRQLQELFRKGPKWQLPQGVDSLRQIYYFK